MLADQLSRRIQILPAEWSLHPDICRAIWKVWGAPHVDLFATARNKKLALYCSPVLDPEAWSTEALTTPWDNLWSYAYPPMAVLTQVLTKLGQSSHAQMISCGSKMAPTAVVCGPTPLAGRSFQRDSSLAFTPEATSSQQVPSESSHVQCTCLEVVESALSKIGLSR